MSDPRTEDLAIDGIKELSKKVIALEASLKSEKTRADGNYEFYEKWKTRAEAAEKKLKQFRRFEAAGLSCDHCYYTADLKQQLAAARAECPVCHGPRHPCDSKAGGSESPATVTVIPPVAAANPPAKPRRKPKGEG